MSLDSLKSLALAPFKSLVDFGTSLLTQPRAVYNPAQVSNISALKSRLRLGDVVLISGNARISHVVKLLTLSQWSHVVLYVGDRKDLLKEEEIERWTKKFGANSLKHLVVDADPVYGTHLKPMDDFVGLMARHCRAEALTKEDCDAVVSHALAQLGREYDVGHILRLLGFYAVPWELFPETLRRLFTDFYLSEDDRICSRVLAEAFHSVGYPISPREVFATRSDFHERALGLAYGIRNKRKSAVKLFTAGRFGEAYSRLGSKKYYISLQVIRHITPADYDLSRFFTVIKDKEDTNFDYKSARTLCRVDN